MKIKYLRPFDLEKCHYSTEKVYPVGIYQKCIIILFSMLYPKHIFMVQKLRTTHFLRIEHFFYRSIFHRKNHYLIILEMLVLLQYDFVMLQLLRDRQQHGIIPLQTKNITKPNIKSLFRLFGFNTNITVFILISVQAPICAHPVPFHTCAYTMLVFYIVFTH